jgi:copper chaperone
MITRSHDMSTTSRYRVTGMTCDHCVTAVTEELSALPGVRDVQVALVTGGTSDVRVVSESPLAENAVREAVDEAGYEYAGAAP